MSEVIAQHWHLAWMAAAAGYGEAAQGGGKFGKVAENEILVSIRDREAKVRAAVVANPGLTTRELVPHVYADVPEHLYAWAERSLLAHLLKLEEDGAATREAGAWDIEAG